MKRSSPVSDVVSEEDFERDLALVLEIAREIHGGERSLSYFAADVVVCPKCRAEWRDRVDRRGDRG
jgi:hypothetical protein